LHVFAQLRIAPQNPKTPREWICVRYVLKISYNNI